MNATSPATAGEVLETYWREVFAQCARPCWLGSAVLVLSLLVAEAPAQEFTYMNINGAIAITGSTALSRVPAKLWNPQVQTQNGHFGVRQNGFGFDISGTPDIPLIVEASTNIAAQSWVPMQGCTLTNGSIYFSDPLWTNYASRVYRIRSP